MGIPTIYPSLIVWDASSKPSLSPNLLPPVLLRDIDNLLKTLNSELNTDFSMTYTQENDMNTLMNTSLTMTSKEIAELTGKRHDNVLRDIDNLLKTLSPELGSGFSMTYEGDPAHGYRYFILDRDSTYCLVAGYDANARLRQISSQRP